MKIGKTSLVEQIQNMSYPILQTENLNLSKGNDIPVAKHELWSLYKSSHRKYVQKLSIQNNKGRCYCNITTAMRKPLYAIIDDLMTVQKKAMAFLLPETLDHYLLDMIFTMIEKTTNMIDWKTMNHKCFWNDFRRQSRNLRHLISEAQTANFECCHTVVDTANKATEILQEFALEKTRMKENMTSTKQVYKSELEKSCYQKPEDLPRFGIKCICCQPYDTVTIQWVIHDANQNTVHSVMLLQASDSFRLRLLRFLMSYARKALEMIILSMRQVEVALRTEFSLDKLSKCDGLNRSELLPHERAVMFKSKNEFDICWKSIMVIICRFRIQLQQLDTHKVTLKRLLKNSAYSSRICPWTEKIVFNIEDNLLTRFVDHVTSDEMNETSYNFTMYSDRAEDIIEIIQDMWKTQGVNFKTIEILFLLIYRTLSQVFEIMSKEDRKDFRKLLHTIFEQRDKVKRYIKKSLAIFNHKAFRELSIYNTTLPTKIHPNIGMDASSLDNKYDSDSEDSDSEDKDFKASLFWVQLQGGLEVAIGEQQEFIIVNRFKDQFQFKQLMEDEQIVVTNKLMSELLHFVSAEASLAKSTSERSHETKSFVKRLKPKDRRNSELVATVTSVVDHMKDILQLMKKMNVLWSFEKRA